jgi:hypothetical protein
MDDIEYTSVSRIHATAANEYGQVRAWMASNTRVSAECMSQQQMSMGKCETELLIKWSEFQWWWTGKKIKTKTKKTLTD